MKKFLLRMPPELFNIIKLSAVNKNRSINQEILNRIEKTFLYEKTEKAIDDKYFNLRELDIPTVEKGKHF